MSLKITSIVRNGPAGCSHYTLTINNNGVSHTVSISMPQILSTFNEFPGGSREALVFAWARDRFERGATAAQCTNVEIESVIT